MAALRRQTGLRCGAVFTTVGLVLDMIGALALLLGLFRHPRLLYPGWERSPQDAAKDRAFGITAGVFLITGFAGQIAGNAGVGPPAMSLACAVVVGIAGLGFAYGRYRASFTMALTLGQRWVKKQPDMADMG